MPLFICGIYIEFEFEFEFEMNSMVFFKTKKKIKIQKMTQFKINFSSDEKEQIKLEDLLRKSIVNDGISAFELMDPQLRLVSPLEFEELFKS